MVYLSYPFEAQPTIPLFVHYKVNYTFYSTHSTSIHTPIPYGLPINFLFFPMEINYLAFTLAISGLAHFDFITCGTIYLDLLLSISYFLTHHSYYHLITSFVYHTLHIITICMYHGAYKLLILPCNFTLACHFFRQISFIWLLAITFSFSSHLKITYLSSVKS